MAAFITREELHRATEEDYRVLHEGMRGRGFTKHVTSSNGTVYLLPPGEYNYEADVDIPGKISLLFRVGLEILLRPGFFLI